jgi:aspartate aminotransferase
MAFIQRFYPHSRRVYIPNPTWGNHKAIIQHAGLEFQEYTYYNPDTKGLNFEDFIGEIDSAPKNSVFLLHACAHNPTGVDPSQDQWREIQDLMARKQHLAVFDMAYQGFASGDVDKDAFPVRLFANEENPMIVMQSFAKNFGLYGERIGNLTVVCDSPQETDRVLSQLKILARPMYSNPPIYGSRIVSTVLGNPELKSQWLVDVKTMADRIINMRNSLANLLKAKGSLHDWSHIVKQIGMFAYTGLLPEHCNELMDKHHIYLTMDGRISMAGLNSKNVEYVAEAIETVTRFNSDL